MGRLKHDPSIQHFSHPHPLELSNLENQQPNFNPPPCSACKHPLSGLIYSCKTCNFNLHLSCSQKPQHINHPSDPNHPLTLLPFPTYADGNFACNACGLDDNGFCYHCSACNLDLHIHCASMPMSLNHQAHPHTLRLSIQETSFICDMCCKFARNMWCYECRACDFGVHLSCASNPHAQASYVRPDEAVQAQVQAQVQAAQVLALSQQRLATQAAINRLSMQGSRNAVILTAPDNVSFRESYLPGSTLFPPFLPQ